MMQKTWHNDEQWQTLEHHSTIRQKMQGPHIRHTQLNSQTAINYSLGKIYKFIATLVAGSQLTFHSTVYLHETGYVIFSNLKTEIN